MMTRRELLAFATMAKSLQAFRATPNYVVMWECAFGGIPPLGKWPMTDPLTYEEALRRLAWLVRLVQPHPQVRIRQETTTRLVLSHVWTGRCDIFTAEVV